MKNCPVLRIYLFQDQFLLHYLHSLKDIFMRYNEQYNHAMQFIPGTNLPSSILRQDHYRLPPY